MTKEFDERSLGKSRAVCAAMAEAASTGKRVLSERERQILDMWPRYEDGEYVWFGDKVDGLCSVVGNFDIYESTTNLYDVDVNHIHLSVDERVKRPARSVLDADGVEIEVGDTVWEPSGQGGIVTAVHPSTRCVDLRQDGCDAYAMDARRLSHTPPDSWERLEEDACKQPYAYCVERGLYKGGDEYAPCAPTDERFARDIVRRAKALAKAGEE